MNNYIGLLVGIIMSISSFAQPGMVLSEQKISDTEGDFTGVLDDGDRFGEAMENIGDLNDDGVTDLAIAAVSDDDGGSSAGAVYILFMNNDGTVSSHQKISNGTGGLSATLSASDRFGSGIAALDDLDGDGVEDIAVGASGDDTGGSSGGAVYILFMNADGTVSSEQKIAHGLGGFSGDLSTGAPEFGVSIAPIGDLDDDGTIDIVVGAFGDDDGGSGRGAAYILFLETDGTVTSDQKISSTAGGFTGTLDDVDQFGFTVTGMDDLDGDGKEDIAIGARLDDDGGTSRGAVWVLFLETDGTVISHQKISTTVGGFTGVVLNSDFFGTAVENAGDINQDGITDLAVGARGDDDGASSAGATWILFMDTDGTVQGDQLISATTGGFTGPLDGGDQFGFAVSGLGDLDGDGYLDIVVGSKGDDDGGSGRGAAYVLFLDGCNVNADFTVDDLTPCQDHDVEFTNTSVNTGTVSFEWLEDGSSVATTTDLTHAFGTGGSIEMALVTSKLNCLDDTTTAMIEVTPSTYASIEDTVCESFTVPSGDETYTTSGTYNDTIPNSVGCDSVMTFDVIINSASSSSFTGNGCLSYTVPSGDETYTTDGVVMDTIPNAVGCDSVMTITVDVGTFASSSFSVTECGSYTVPSGDETYTASGIYEDTIPSTDGCDSIMTIDVTINMPTTSSFAVTECDSYTVPSGDETYTASGVFNDTIPNSVGCDSVMTIDITINMSTTSTLTLEECNEYTVPSGDETYTASGTYMDTIANASGCDSVMTIDLTIITVDTSVTVTDTSLMSNATGATYQWIDCDSGTPVSGETDALFVPSSDGSYAVVVTEGSCTDTSACYDFNGLGIDAISGDWLTVYPNPTQGIVNLKFNTVQEQLSIQVRDISGRLVYDAQLNDKKQHTFNIEGEGGIYFVDVIRPEGTRSTIKVVKR